MFYLLSVGGRRWSNKSFSCEAVRIRGLRLISFCSEKGRRCCRSDGISHELNSCWAWLISTCCFTAVLLRLTFTNKTNVSSRSSSPSKFTWRFLIEERLIDNEIVHLMDRCREMIVFLEESKAFVRWSIDSQLMRQTFFKLYTKVRVTATDRKTSFCTYF